MGSDRKRGHAQLRGEFIGETGQQRTTADEGEALDLVVGVGAGVVVERAADLGDERA